VNTITAARPLGSPPLAGEEERRRQLQMMKRRATGLLVAVTAAWVAMTVLDHGGVWSGYARAAAEASMVGGLADWFAVTALFRHPLGLPIPHTAVIAERKEQFGQTLGDFVQKNFLSSDVIAERLRASGVVGRVADWLADPANAGNVARHVADVAVAFADVVHDEDVHRLVENEARRAVMAVPLAPLAGRVLRALAADGREQEALDAALPWVERFLWEHRENFRARFVADSPWWLPGLAENRIFDRLFDGLVDLLADVKADPNHDLRRQFSTSLWMLVKQLETSSELRERGEALKRNLLANPQVRRWSASLWGDLKAALRAQAADPDSELRHRLARAVAAAGSRLRDDAALRDKAEDLLESAARTFTERFHGEIAGLVSQTIARWDAGETSRKLELLLGRDLQFIRINGTVVGGLAGVVIHAGGLFLK
jgi:uncharacterized membrane-anchored protein YjiN (DUF445 family)